MCHSAGRATPLRGASRQGVDMPRLVRVSLCRIWRACRCNPIARQVRSVAGPHSTLRYPRIAAASGSIQAPPVRASECRLYPSKIPAAIFKNRWPGPSAALPALPAQFLHLGCPNVFAVNVPSPARLGPGLSNNRLRSRQARSILIRKSQLKVREEGVAIAFNLELASSRIAISSV